MESVSIPSFKSHGPWCMKIHQCSGFQNIMHEVFVNIIICNIVSLLFAINIDWSEQLDQTTKFFNKVHHSAQNNQPKYWNTTLLSYINNSTEFMHSGGRKFTKNTFIFDVFPCRLLTFGFLSTAVHFNSGNLFNSVFAEWWNSEWMSEKEIESD